MKRQRRKLCQKSCGQPSLEQINNLKNPEKISAEKIARAITAEETQETKIKNKKKWESQITPAKDAINDTLYTIEKTPTLFLSADMNKVLNIMATEGHAQNGHATYQTAFPNTTRFDIINAISEKGTPLLKKKFADGKFQNTTQKYCDNIVETLANGLYSMENARKNGKKIKKINLRGLNGITCFEDIDPLEGARGFFLATNMDTPEIRNLAFQKYGYQMGTGKSLLTQTKRLQELDIGISDMSKINYKNSLEVLNKLSERKRLDILKNLKIIKKRAPSLEEISSGEISWEEAKLHSNSLYVIKNPKFREQYIRNTIGKGVGDDISIFLAGFLPPTIYNEGHKESPLSVQSKIIMALLGDHIDTLSGDQDEIAGKYINGIFNKLAQNPDFRKAYNIKKQPNGEYNLLTLDELIDFTVAGANTAEEHVHSSQRYFWKNENGTCAVTEYMKYAYYCAKTQNKKIKLSDIRKFKIKLEKDISHTKFTFERIPAEKILSIMNERLYLVMDPNKREQRLKKYFSEHSQKLKNQSTPQ